jgi:hypothetical protein
LALVFCLKKKVIGCDCYYDLILPLSQVNAVTPSVTAQDDEYPFCFHATSQEKTQLFFARSKK